jgi:cytochrome b561
MNSLVAVHMAVGIAIIVLLIGRVILRVKTNKPLEATTGNRFFDSLAKFVHYGLYVMVLAVTIIGLIFSLQTGRFQSVFLGAESRFGPPNGFPHWELWLDVHSSDGRQPEPQNGPGGPARRWLTNNP